MARTTHRVIASTLFLALACPPAMAQNRPPPPGILSSLRPAKAAGRVDCVMRPSEQVKLSSAVEGIIGSIAVKRGDFVRRGQVVARLESRVELAELQLATARADNPAGVGAAKARMEFLKRKVERARQLNLKKITSDLATEEAESNLKVAEQEYVAAQVEQRLARLEQDRARAYLAQRMIVSPVSGVVVERPLSVGEHLNEQSHIMTIAQVDPINVEVFAPISLHGKVKVGDSAVVRPEAPVGGSYAARVAVVDRVFDAASSTFGVRLTLPNPKLMLPTGIKCQVSFN